MIHYFTILAATVAVCTAVNGNLIGRVNELVNVEFYYESLCSNSIRFVDQQLVATYADIGSYINVTYIPYGKATHEKVTLENGTQVWNFTCQHGEAECYGNKAQACAIHQILTNSEISDEQQVLVNFVGCVMSADNPAVAVPQCLNTIGIDANYISLVNDCIASTDGDELLAAHGDKTHALQPALTSLPTIVINEASSEEERDTARVDFQGLICEYIPAESQPAVCNGSTSQHTKLNIVAITMFALFLCVGKEMNGLF